MTLLKTLAHEQRLAVLCELVGGPLAVGEIGSRTAIAQPMLSQHLAALRLQGLVRSRREGRRVRYEICSHAAALVIEALHAAFCAAEPPEHRPAFLAGLPGDAVGFDHTS